MCELGLLLEMKCRFDEAENCYAKAFSAKKDVLGTVDTSTCETAVVLGDFYRKLSRWQLAADHYQFALEGFTERLGEEHEVTQQVSKRLQLVRQQASAVCSVS